MPVVKEVISAGILASMTANTKEGAEAQKQFADDLAAVITTAILSATVTVPVIPVQVVPVTGTGATLAPVVASIT